MALLVGRLGKKIYWHNPIYCALFKLSIRENLCIQIPGKFVTHLMCSDNNILHTFFFFYPTAAPEHSPVFWSDAHGIHGCHDERGKLSHQSLV